MKWYDIFSSFYDKSLEKLYFQSRQRAVELLDLHDNQTVLDLACGTGANFKHLKAANSSIKLFGTDYSKGMLEKAQKWIDNNDWPSVVLFQADGRNLNTETIVASTTKNIKFDRIICVLGLSVMPEWESILDNMLNLLTPDGKVVVVDVFAEKRTFNTWLVEKIAKADLNREIWQTIKNKTTDFTVEYLPVKENKVGGKLFVCAANK